MTISYTLAERAGTTVLTLAQDNLPSQPLYELMEGQVWDYLLGALKEYVEAAA